MDALEQALAAFFLGTLPAFPEELKRNINKFYPWLMIVFSALSLIVVLPLLGFGALFSWMSPVHGSLYMVIMILLLIRAVFGLFGGIRMLSASKMGWNLALYSDLVIIIVNILDFSFGGLIWNFFMLWALFQIREYYTDSNSTSSF